MKPYTVDEHLPPDAWNALDEQERVHLVAATHARTGSPTGQSPMGHAAIHVAVENRLAEGHDAVVRAYDRFRAAGVSRHVTIHALASVMTKHMMAVLESQTPFDAAADADYDHLDPVAFGHKPKR